MHAHTLRRLTLCSMLLVPVGLPLLAPPSLAAAKKREKPAEPVADPAQEKEKAAKEKAQQLFDSGLKLYDLRKFDQAIAEFERAYQVLPQPAFLYNIAQAHRLAGHRDDAIGFYQNYLRRMPAAPNRAEVEEQVKNLQIEKEAAAKAGGKEPRATSRTVTQPPAQPYPEPRTKHNFLTRLRVGDKDHTLIGVGSRTYVGFLVYGMALYVEDEPARALYPKLVAQAGGSDIAQLQSRDLAQAFVVLGDFGKAALLYYSRDIPTQKIRDSYREMLKDDLGPTTPPLLRQHTEEFLALFDRDMKGGEEMLIAADREGNITVSVGSYRRKGPKDARLALDLWNCWLGPKAISTELKQGLVRRINALGE